MARQSKPGFAVSKKDISPADGGFQKGSYSIKGRIWLQGKKGTFLGYGRVVLLERIREHGSISKAAKSLSMAYRHAWDLVDSMNQQSKTALVVAVTGGRRGGGAKLTETGERAIEAFWELYERFQDFLKKEVRRLGI